MTDFANTYVLPQDIKKTKKTNTFLSIEPLHNNIVIKFKDKEEKVGSLFIIQNDEDQKSQEGIVYSLPADFSGKVKLGDIVLFSAHAGVKIEIEEEKVLVLDYEEIIGILR